jgi:NADPH2:quinone reductase
MKAIQITQPGPPSALELVTLPTPRPGAGEVLVRIHAIGVALPDALVRSGKFPWMPPFPHVPGNEASGRVVDANGSTRLREGQPVFFTTWDVGHAGGLYAEYIVMKEDAPWILPEHVDLDEAASLFNYVVAWLLMRYGARGAETSSVLVHGASGGVGTSIVELARLEGTAVIGTASSDEKCRFLLERGVQHAINYRTEKVVERALEATDGRGVDVIYNHIAGDSFKDDLKMLAPMGLLVSYGLLGGLPKEDVFKEMRANLDRSPSIRTFATHTIDKVPGARRAAMEAAIDLLGQGRIKPAITLRLPLADAARSH